MSRAVRRLGEGRRLRPLLVDRRAAASASRPASPPRWPAITTCACSPTSDVDLGWLGERLHLDLSGVGVDVLDDDLGVTRASAAYDLLVNASYLSWDANRARHGHLRRALPRARARAGPSGPAAGSPAGAAGALGRRRGARSSWASGSTRPSRPGCTASAGPGATPSCWCRPEHGGPVPVTVLLGRYLPPAVAPRRGPRRGRRRGARAGRSLDAPASRLDRRRSVALRFTVDVPAGRDRARRPALPVVGAGRGGHRRRPAARSACRSSACTPAAAGGAAWPGRCPPSPARPGVPAHLDTLRPPRRQLALHPGLDRAAVAPAERPAVPAGRR